MVDAYICGCVNISIRGRTCLDGNPFSDNGSGGEEEMCFEDENLNMESLCAASSLELCGWLQFPFRLKSKNKKKNILQP